MWSYLNLFQSHFKTTMGWKTFKLMMIETIKQRVNYGGTKASTLSHFMMLKSNKGQIRVQKASLGKVKVMVKSQLKVNIPCPFMLKVSCLFRLHKSV